MFRPFIYWWSNDAQHSHEQKIPRNSYVTVPFHMFVFRFTGTDLRPPPSWHFLISHVSHQHVHAGSLTGDGGGVSEVGGQQEGGGVDGGNSSTSPNGISQPYSCEAVGLLLLLSTVLEADDGSGISRKNRIDRGKKSEIELSINRFA